MNNLIFSMKWINYKFKMKNEALSKKEISFKFDKNQNLNRN